MGNSFLRRRETYSTLAKMRLPPRVPVSAAVLFALYGMPNAAGAQQSTDTQQQTGPQTNTLQEVVVTATRHEQSLESVPYSIAVISGDEIARTGVTDLASPAAQE